MWSPDLREEEEIDYETDYIEYDYEVESDIDIQPITNFWEFLLLILMYPSFFTRNLN